MTTNQPPATQATATASVHAAVDHLCAWPGLITAADRHRLTHLLTEHTAGRPSTLTRRRARILAAATDAAPAGITRTEVSRRVLGNMVPAEQVDLLLEPLLADGRLVATTRPPAAGSGRPVTVYHATPPPADVPVPADLDAVSGLRLRRLVAAYRAGLPVPPAGERDLVVRRAVSLVSLPAPTPDPSDRAARMRALAQRLGVDAPAEPGRLPVLASPPDADPVVYAAALDRFRAPGGLDGVEPMDLDRVEVAAWSVARAESLATETTTDDTPVVGS